MMKKIVGVIVILVLLLAGGQAYGAVSSLIGKKVSKEMDLKFNGVSVGKVIVVEGKSYVPVRDFADLLELGLSSNKESVNLDGEVTTDNQIELESLNRQKEELIKSIDHAKSGIAEWENVEIPELQSLSDMYKDNPEEDPHREQRTALINKYKDQVAQKKAAIPELQSMLDSVNQKITTLEAQTTTTP
jgi:hypothetical protein